MFSLKSMTLILCLWCAAASNIYAQDSGFTTPAPHVIIMDYETGVVLYEKDARRAIAPASMTKIMTAEMVFERIKNGSISLETEFPVSEEAWRRGGAASGSSTMFLDLNSKASVEDLLRGVIIQSGNDACIVLAEGIAGSETAFADLMTKHAREIGLESATFRNATGWPHDEHLISLYDLAQLAKRTIKDYPEFYKIYSERDFTWNGITQGNRNPLLGRFTGSDGLKTGHTESSGYGLVASAKRGDMRRIMVVNGLESKAQRRDESLRLMEASFDQFELQRPFAASEKVADLNVFMGKSDTVSVATDEPVQFGVFRGDAGKVKIQMRHTETIAAPISKGDHVADMLVKIPGEDARIYKLKATEDVKQKSAIGRVLTVISSKFGGA